MICLLPVQSCWSCFLHQCHIFSAASFGGRLRGCVPAECCILRSSKTLEGWELPPLLDEIRAGFVLLIEVWVSVGCCSMLALHLHWLQINICVFNPHVLSPKHRGGMCVDFWCRALVLVHGVKVLAQKGGWEEKPPDLLYDHQVPLGLVFKNCHHFALPEWRLLRRAGREGLPHLQNERLERAALCSCSRALSPLSLQKSWLPGEGSVEVTALPVRASHALFLSPWICWAVGGAVLQRFPALWGRAGGKFIFTCTAGTRGSSIC